MIGESEAIELATIRLQQVYPEPKLLKSFHSDQLEEFPGASGWTIWFAVDDSDFGPYDRPVEVDEKTGEARLVRILL